MLPKSVCVVPSDKERTTSEWGRGCGGEGRELLRFLRGNTDTLSKDLLLVLPSVPYRHSTFKMRFQPRWGESNIHSTRRQVRTANARHCRTVHAWTQ